MFLSWCWKTLFEIILGRHLYLDSVNASEKENLTSGVNLEQVWFDSVLSSLLSLILDTSVLVWLFSQPCRCLTILSQLCGTPCYRYICVVGASAQSFLLRAVIKSALMFCILTETRAIWSYLDPILSILQGNKSSYPLTRYKTLYSFIWYRQQWLYTICVYNMLQELYKSTWLSSHHIACLHMWNIITMHSRVLHTSPW